MFSQFNLRVSPITSRSTDRHVTPELPCANYLAIIKFIIRVLQFDISHCTYLWFKEESHIRGQQVYRTRQDIIHRIHSFPTPVGGPLNRTKIRREKETITAETSLTHNIKHFVWYFVLKSSLKMHQVQGGLYYKWQKTKLNKRLYNIKKWIKNVEQNFLLRCFIFEKIYFESFI